MLPESDSAAEHQHPKRAPLPDATPLIETLRNLRLSLGEPVDLRAMGALRKREWLRDIEASIERAIQSIPDEPGPLNSQMLAVKTLLAIGDRSPDYLKHLVAYLDVLLWLEEQQ